ncbi:MAG: hypothetical protein AAFQ91_33475 [Cyanobacteria bacterium J06621_15]
MGIIGSDNRSVVTESALGFFSSVVAVDRLTSTGASRPGVGSGIIIGPNHILTAAHVLFPKQDIIGDPLLHTLGARITLAENVPDLEPRPSTPISADTRNINDYSVNLTADGFARIVPGSKRQPIPSRLLDEEDVALLNLIGLTQKKNLIREV